MERINLRATPDSEVVKNFKRKKDLLGRGDLRHETIKTAIIADGGVMLGAFGGGVVTGLQETGFCEVADYAVGVSAGADDLAYFIAGQSRIGTSIYYEDLIEGRFIDLLRC